MKLVIPRHAGLEDSYVHSHHPNVLSEAMARIFVAGIHRKCRDPLCLCLLVSYRPLAQTDATTSKPHVSSRIPTTEVRINELHTTELAAVRH